jgi:hypothetical protein
VKRTGILATLLAMALLLSSFGCGGAAIGSLKAINLTTSGGATPNLVGTGGTVQLTATGIYTSSDTRDLSSHVTYAVTPQGTDLAGVALPPPPQTVTISPTGLVTAVTPFDCTWTNTGSTPLLTGSYQVVATFKGISSNPVFISVASMAGNGPNGECGP